MPAPRKPRKASVSAKSRKPRDLTREKAIVAGLALVNEKGAEALTMRGVADALGVTPMALYNHFSSKRDLLSAIAEHVIGSADFDARHAEWRHQVRHCFGVLRRICLDHPGLPRLLEVDGAAPASVFAPMEVAICALQRAGLEPLDSLRAYFLLLNFTLGQAAYQTRPLPDLEPSERVRAERIAGRGYTATERLQLPEAWDYDATFAFGLTLILDGVETAVSGRRNPRR